MEQYENNQLNNGQGAYFQGSANENVNYSNNIYQGNGQQNSYMQGGHAAMLNGKAVSTDKMAAEMEKEENVGLGILGSIGGALIGAVFMVVLYKLGRVAFYTGVIMGLCAFKGYEMLSGRKTKKGIVISIIAVLAMVYVGTRFCFALDITSAFKGYNVFEAFIEVDEKIAQFNLGDAFNEMLIQQYIFAGIGAVIAVFSKIGENKENTSQKGIGAFRK